MTELQRGIILLLVKRVAIERREQDRVAQKSGEVVLLFASHPQIVLEPGAAPAGCMNRIEARYLYDHDIPKYFDEGVLLRPGDTVIDVGANVGLFALLVLKRCANDANLYSFEPIPATFEILKQNAARFAPGKWRSFPVGLARDGGQVRFSYFPRLASWSSAYVDKSSVGGVRARLKQCLSGDVEEGRLFAWLRPAPAALRSLVLDVVVWWLTRIVYFTCEVKPLSQVLREERIARVDLLKVDVEGGEFDVLLGIADDDWPKIRQIVVEVEAFSTRAGDIEALLRKRGFAHVSAKQSGATDAANDFGLLWARREDAATN